MKDATTLMSEEHNLTVSLIAQLQNMSDTIRDSPMVHENAIKTDLLKSYSSESEKKILYTASALDYQFKGMPFLTERLEIYREWTEEAASVVVIPCFLSNGYNFKLKTVIILLV